MTRGGTLQLGPLNIPSMWLFFAASVAAGALLVGLLSLRRPEIRRRALDTGLNGALIFFAVWKLSPLIASPGTIIHEPLALLYLPGGTTGVILGGAAALVLLTISVVRTQCAIRVEVSKRLAMWALVVAAGSGAAWLLVPDLPVHTAGTPAVGTRAGEEAPSFSLSGLRGGTGGIDQGPAQVTFINFWATWCPPCRAEIPELARFADTLGDSAGVELYLVDMTNTEHAAAANPSTAVEKFLADHRAEILAPRVLLDVTGSTAALYGVSSVPTTFVVRGRQIATVHRGVVTYDWLRRMAGEGAAQ